MNSISLVSDNVKESVIIKTREASLDIQNYLKDILSLLQDLDYSVEDTLDKNELFGVLNEDLPDSSLGSARQKFIDDLIYLCELFFKQVKSQHIRIQLRIVRTDMCRLFHVDNIKQRLLCTYLGPGTEWLDHSNVSREGLGKGCNSKIVKDFQKVHRAEPFEVLTLKGLKSEINALGAVHRSPPLSESSPVRVLLKIDEH